MIIVANQYHVPINYEVKLQYDSRDKSIKETLGSDIYLIFYYTDDD